MDKHEICEQRGRQKAYNLLHKHYQLEFENNQYSRADLYATATTTGTKYIIEIKNYEEDRPFTKYKDYLIDFDKLNAVYSLSLEDKRRAIVLVFFTDCIVAWDLADSVRKWQSKKEWRWVNKDGQDYGKKEYSLVTYLDKEDAKWIKKL